MLLEKDAMKEVDVIVHYLYSKPEQQNNILSLIGTKSIIFWSHEEFNPQKI